MTKSLDVNKLEQEVKAVYRDVAEAPDGEFHFEVGRPLVEHLGYQPEELEWAPEEAIDSFAGVGYHFNLTDLQKGENVSDLGSGSEMDVFVAALHVYESRSVTGFDMIDEQLENARHLRDGMGFQNVTFEKGHIANLPFEDETVDVVVSNGVINLSAEKDRVFEEVSRVLKPGGRLALSDIISEQRLSESIKTDADLWAACIGGAEQVDDYTAMIETPSFDPIDVRDNSQYEFTSDQRRVRARSTA